MGWPASKARQQSRTKAATWRILFLALLPYPPLPFGATDWPFALCKLVPQYTDRVGEKNPTNSFNCSFFHCPLPGGTEGCDTHDTYNASCKSNVFCKQIANRFLKGFRFQFAFACLWFFLGSSQRAWCLTLDLVHAQTSEEVSLYSAGMYPLCYAILCYAMPCYAMSTSWGTSNL